MPIREMLKEDWPEVRSIYQLGLDTGIASFESEAPNWEKFQEKFLQTGRLVLADNDYVFGWTALSRVSARFVYRGVAELSIYLHPEAQGRGFGIQLMQRLIHFSEEAGIWTLHSAIFPQNKASIALHQKCGFRSIGLRERIAFRDGQWHDNLLMERRSKTVGIDAPQLTIPN